MRKITLTIFILTLLLYSSFGKNKEQDAIYKSIEKSYTLNFDGSTDYRERKELKIFTTMTFDYFGETFITYNPDFQKLTINEAYVIKDDGTKVETPQNAFNPMLPENCTKCERLNSIREMVVTHTALEHNATIVLDYTIHSDNFFFDRLFETVTLCEAVPVEKFTLTVSVPEDRPLNWNLNFGELQYSKKQVSENSMKRTEWKFQNLPATPSESYIFKTSLPTLSFYSLDYAEDFINSLTQQAAFNQQVTKDISNFFVKLTSDKTTDIDKAIVVRDYISTNISTKKANQKLLNHVLATPEHVWLTNCALSIEKEILLSRVLQNLGFNARVAFSEKNIFSTDGYNAFVCMISGSDTVFISASDADELDLRAKLAPTMIIFEDGFIKQMKPIATKVEVEADINFRNNDINSPYSTLIAQKIESPFTKTLQQQDTVVAKPYIQEVGNIYLLKINDGKYGTTISSREIFRDRKNNINTKPSTEKYVYHITLPEGYEVLTKPYCLEKNLEGARMVEKIDIAEKKASITRILELPEKGISAKSARKFKEMMGKWETPKQIVIGKRP